ncbi:MAG: PhnD/SsuA/transferrin family substrate-binding protein [Desulfobacterales bacterium]|nr:PhnD/SsuA/transferrin family substrate-binding protein [Desulfobacterales bacterium]
MSKKLVILLAIIFNFCFFQYADSSDALNLGMIDSSASKMIKRFTPLLKYLESQGVAVGKIKVAKNLDEMITFFEKGEVDFLFESPYGALKLMDATGAIPVIIREKDGVNAS